MRLNIFFMFMSHLCFLFKKNCLSFFFLSFPSFFYFLLSLLPPSQPPSFCLLMVSIYYFVDIIADIFSPCAFLYYLWYSLLSLNSNLSIFSLVICDFYAFQRKFFSTASCLLKVLKFYLLQLGV